ncbi:unnamed protein product, partial [Polarella glacialis]
EVDATAGHASVIVPESAVPGATGLRICVGGGRKVTMTVPKQALAGDTLKLALEGELGWRCDIVPLKPRPQRRKGRVCALVPGNAVPGTSKVFIDTLDGKMVQIAVPQAAAPGDTMVLTAAGKTTNEWQCTLEKQAYDLTAPAAVPPMEDELRHAELRHVLELSGGFWNLKLRRSPCLGVPGVVVVEGVAAGEELARTPAALFLSPEAVRRAAPQLALVVASLVEEMPRDNQSAELTLQAAFLAGLLAAREEEQTTPTTTTTRARATTTATATAT